MQSEDGAWEWPSTASVAATLLVAVRRQTICCLTVVPPCCHQQRNSGVVWPCFGGICLLHAHASSCCLFDMLPIACQQSGPTARLHRLGRCPCMLNFAIVPLCICPLCIHLCRWTCAGARGTSAVSATAPH